MSAELPQIELPTALARVIHDSRVRRADVARYLDPPVDISTVTRWCSGERPIPDERVAQLAELLGVSQAEIRGEGRAA